MFTTSGSAGSIVAILVILYIILIAQCVLGIITLVKFITGLVNCGRKMNTLDSASQTELAGMRKQMIVFFVLGEAIFLVGIVFLILCLIKREAVVNYAGGIGSNNGSSQPYVAGPASYSQPAPQVAQDQPSVVDAEFVQPQEARVVEEAQADETPTQEEVVDAATEEIKTEPVASFCPNCGSKIDPEGSFCMNCGTKVR